MSTDSLVPYFLLSSGLSHQIFLLEFCQIPDERSGQPPENFNSFYCQLPLFSLWDNKVLEELETSMSWKSCGPQGRSEKEKPTGNIPTWCLWAHTQLSCPPLPKSPYPSPLSGFIHHDSLMKGWFGGWRSPDYTQIYTCTYQRENTYNYIKTICFHIYTVYSDLKLTVSRHSSS